jgi:hypothetical protein
MMATVIEKARQMAGSALINVMDVSRKTELFTAQPLGQFGVGGMVDVYA